MRVSDRPRLGERRRVRARLEQDSHSLLHWFEQDLCLISKTKDDQDHLETVVDVVQVESIDRDYSNGTRSMGTTSRPPLLLRCVSIRSVGVAVGRSLVSPNDSRPERPHPRSGSAV